MLTWFKIIVVIVGIIVLSLAVLSITQEQLPASFGAASLGTAKELSSPGNWVAGDQIKVYPSQVVLQVPGATWATFTDTNSMDPVLDETAHALEIKPEQAKDIEIGDIISYKTSYGVIVHRVVGVGEDPQGIYYTVKGDNTTFQDPLRVRFEDVQGVVVAVIY